MDVPDIVTRKLEKEKGEYRFPCTKETCPKVSARVPWSPGDLPRD
jgi:hypothetical protein